MDPKELREQAKRWRSRAPAADEPTAEALVEAAQSFEGLAEDTEKATGKPEAPGEFMHRAYNDKTKKK
ncbi:MAG: hypothetical protein HY060_02705 [Proteobacteria bacterium]|nr:hypothetical protein [Pseudomonadota bacterium]